MFNRPEGTPRWGAIPGGMRVTIAAGIDRAIAAVSPSWAARRVAARMRYVALSTYEAAKKRRVERDWTPSNKSADQAIVDDLPTLRARARAAVRDTWAGASARGGYRRKVVGIGITPRSAATHPDTGTLLEEFNAEVDELWREWANDPTACDAERRKTLIGKQRLWITELFTVGQAFIVPSYTRRKDRVGLVLQEIEPEQLDDTVSSYEGRSVRAGIEIDGVGAAVAYHVHTGKHPLEQYSTNSERIPADQMIHLLDQDRVRQTHGVPWMAPILRKLRHEGMYDEYMLIKARAEAAFTGMVIQDIGLGDANPGLATPSGETGLDADGNVEVNVEPGMMTRLRPGEDVKFPPGNNPNPQYDGFSREQIKRIAAGTGLDYATVARWFADGNFSTQRMNRIETYEETDPLQEMMIWCGLSRIREQFKEYCILERRVKAPRFFTDSRWRRAYLRESWQGPPKTPIDEVKHAAAVKVMLELGLTTRADILNELGLNWRDVFRQIKAEKEYAADQEISLPGLTGPAKTDPHEARPGAQSDRGVGDEEEEEDDEPDGEEPDQQSAGGNGSSRLTGRAAGRLAAIEEP